MSADAGALELIARFVGEALSPLKDRLQANEAAKLFEELGLRPPAGFLTSGGLGAKFASAAQAALDLSSTLPPLTAAIDNVKGDNPGSVVALVQAGVNTTREIVDLVTAIKDVADAVKNGAAALTPQQKATIEAFAAQLPQRLVEYLLLAHLDRDAPRLVAVLAVMGLAEDAIDTGSLDDPLKIPHRARRLRLDAIGSLVKEPKQFYSDLYGWGKPSFDGEVLLARIANLLEVGDLPAMLLHPPGQPAVLEAMLVRLWAAPDPDHGGDPGLWIRLRQAATADFRESMSLGGPWSFTTDAKMRFEAGIDAGLFASGNLVLLPPTGAVKGEVSAGFVARRADGQPMTLIGLAGATRLEVKSFSALAGVRVAGDASGRKEAEPMVSFDLEDLTCVLDLGGGDSFLKSLSGGGRGRTNVSIGARWSPSTGLKLTGSAAVEVAIPAHARIGPATIETIYLVSGIESGKVPLEISASVRGELGPFKASIDRIGVKFDASFPPGGGNLGPLQLDAKFKPPTGIGLSIDGGGFTGGGFLYLDIDKGEYAGGIELEFQEFIHIKAIGLLNTKMPDGSEGFSLLVIITAEFVPIQLGFGFTLIGVGGLLGVNRTALYDELRLGVRDGSLNSILFPKDIAANAPRIISDLKRIFPPRNGRFLIGPMGKLGWGTPALITLELGVILEIPRPAFAILGVLRLALPAEDVAILNLQVSFLGVVDFERKELTFDASLFDSRVLTFTLTGDMAVRLYWGDNANFLLTVGGFHPAYTPPPMGLGPLNRLAIVIFAGNPRLRAEAYFAITSNTVQFGAKIELEAGADIFNVYGFIALDALIQFDPFHFIAQLGGMVAVRSGSSTLFSIRLNLTLEGVTPWRARGTGSFEIGFIFTITISVSFDVSFGDDRVTTLPPIPVTPLIETALGLDGNWRVISDGNLRSQVTLRTLPEGSPLVVPPMGALAVTQKIAPLGVVLQRFGPRRIAGGSRFQIVNVSVGGVDVSTETRDEQFAAAQFFDLSDAEKLSRRSFEPLAAGVAIAGGGAPRATFKRTVEVEYEVIYFRKARRGIFSGLATLLLELYVGISSAARSKLGATRRVPTGLGTPKVTLPAETYVVATVDTLSPHDAQVFTSETAAAVAMQTLVAKDARLAGKLQVVGSYERAA